MDRPSRPWPPLAIVLSVLLTACVGTAPPRPQLAAADLLDGRRLFATPVAPAPGDLHSVLHLDPAIHAFVETAVGGASLGGTRLRRLLDAMHASGLLALDYSADVTVPASAAFHDRRGNCLSFTLLFVAMAREAGLPARFQVVDVPPMWSTDGDLVQLNSHVNAILPGLRADAHFARDVVVDFNRREFDGDFPRRKVPDAWALALYHSNLGVQALADGDDRRAFAHFKAGLVAAPEVAAVWVNLGVLYSRGGDSAAAAAAYAQALQRDPHNASALANLALVLEREGDDAAAARYRSRIARHRARNPYHHFAMARQAATEQRWNAVAEPLATALRLKEDEALFHGLKAELAARNGEAGIARRHLQRARDLAVSEPQRSQYQRRLEALRP